MGLLAVREIICQPLIPERLFICFFDHSFIHSFIQEKKFECFLDAGNGFGARGYRSEFNGDISALMELA